MTEDTRKSRQMFRIFGQLIPSAIWFLLTFTGESIYQSFYIQIQSFFTLVIGFSSVFIALIGGDPDHGPQLLYIFVVWVFLRIPFRAASVVCWLIWVCYSVPLFANVVIAENKFTTIYLAAGNVCLMIAAYSAERNTRDEFSIQKAIQFQQEISQGIMESLLPDHIMERMKADAAAAAEDDYDTAPSVIAEEHETVSVLFSDIAGFTKYCGSITPQETIVFLNDLYTTLDKVCEENNVYKVETIGDAYFVSSGCPKDGTGTYSTGDPAMDAVNIVQCGLGMTTALRQVMLRNRYDHFKENEMVEAVYKRSWFPAQVLNCEWSQGTQDGLTGEMITVGFQDKSLGQVTHDAGAGMIRKIGMEHHPIGELVLAIDTLTKERVIGTVKDVDKVRADCYLVKEDNSTKEFWTAQAYLTPRMRIGIHTGKVIAGVVGYKMPRYHLFGDTVNIAETMESSGVKDYVQVSDSTAALIEDYYVLEQRDKEAQEKIKHETGREKTFIIKGQKAALDTVWQPVDTYETL